MWAHGALRVAAAAPLSSRAWNLPELCRQLACRSEPMSAQHGAAGAARRHLLSSHDRPPALCLRPTCPAPQAVEGHTIASMADRLAKNGFYVPVDMRSASYGDRCRRGGVCGAVRDKMG